MPLGLRPVPPGAPVTQKFHAYISPDQYQSVNWHASHAVQLTTFGQKKKQIRIGPLKGLFFLRGISLTWPCQVRKKDW